MASNQYVNKVIFGSDVIMDISSDTVAANKLLSGFTAHDHTGAPITGECTYDSDTTDADANTDEILAGKYAYVNKVKLTGTMTNQGEKHYTLSARDTEVSIPQGYHDGSGGIGLSAADKTALVAANVRQGVTVLGIEGTMSGMEGVKATSTSITPYTTAQTIVPTDLGDYNSITQISVAAITKTEVDNVAGGKTVTIGAVAPVSGT